MQLNNMFRFRRVLSFISLGILLVCTAYAQPVRDRILGNVEISQGDDQVDVLVGFNFPIQYVSHFPRDKGDELRIKLNPIVVSIQDRNALLRRESVTPPRGNAASIVEVTYEGDTIGNPFLTLVFDHPVDYRVSQGQDFRSLHVIIKGVDGSSTPKGDGGDISR